MGKAELTLTWELVRQWLQLPDDWQPVSAHIEQIGGYTEPTASLHLIVEGTSIEQQAEGSAPIPMAGRFKAKTIESEDGRWVQGHWNFDEWRK